MLLIATLIIKTTEENVSPKSDNILAFFEVNSMFNFFFSDSVAQHPAKNNCSGHNCIQAFGFLKFIDSL